MAVAVLALTGCSAIAEGAPWSRSSRSSDAASGVAAAAPDKAGQPAAAALASLPAGQVKLHAFDVNGKQLSWSAFRAVQESGAGSQGDNDALLDANNLQVLKSWPLAGTGYDITLKRPAGAVTLSLAWPTTAGYSTLLLDLPAPGTYVFNQLAARQAVSDLTAELAARPTYAPSATFAAAWKAARDELALADSATAESDRGVHGARSYEAAAQAQLLLLKEYGTKLAGSTAAGARPPAGFTLDDISTSGTALKAISGIVAATGQAAAVRIVFDAGEPPAYYASTVDAAHKAGIQVVGQFLDSADMARTSLTAWRQRVTAYVAALPTVDVWEVGNEVNGNWLGSGVVDKVAYAASCVKAHTKAQTMLTLYWQLGEDDAQHSMFTWAAHNLTAATMAQIDQIGLSIYPENSPMGIALDRVFRTLHATYPAQRIGITELGYGSADLDHRWWWGSASDWTGSGRIAVADLYSRAVLGYPYSAGGTYWWYFLTEATQGSPLWQAFANVQGDVLAVSGASH